jgi:hypothetical protein
MISSLYPYTLVKINPEAATVFKIGAFSIYLGVSLLSGGVQVYNLDVVDIKNGYTGRVGKTIHCDRFLYFYH